MRAEFAPVAIVLALLASSPAWAAKANWALEFDHAPALDGAGYLVQPLNNVRASGSMALEIGQTLTLPSGVGGGAVDGAGINNGDGTFTYDSNEVPLTGVGMGFTQGAGQGDRDAFAIPSPLVEKRSFTLEARFKVEGISVTDTPLDLIEFTNKSRGSLHFQITYGNLGGTLNSIFPPQAALSSTDIPFVQEEFVTLRIVGTSIPGTPGNIGQVDVFFKPSDSADWLVGPSSGVAQFARTSMNEGALTRLCTQGCGANPAAKFTFDYIRIVEQTLALTEPVEAAGAEPIPGDFNGDGSVNAADYAVWQSGFAGTLKGSDLLAWQRNFGATAAAVSAGAVPEASAGALALCGLAALAAGRRKGGGRKIVEVV